MASQATLNGGTNRIWTPNEPEGVIEGVGSLGSNLANLAMLQARLALIDLRDSLLAARVSLIVLATGLLLIPCCLVIGLLGLADWLADLAHARPYAVRMILAAGVIVVGAVAGLLALRRLTRSFTSFRRSQDELQRNLAWVRTVLSHSGR